MEEDSKELWEGEKKKKKSKESLVGNGWGGGIKRRNWKSRFCICGLIMKDNQESVCHSCHGKVNVCLFVWMASTDSK